MIKSYLFRILIISLVTLSFSACSGKSFLTSDTGNKVFKPAVQCNTCANEPTQYCNECVVKPKPVVKCNTCQTCNTCVKKSVNYCNSCQSSTPVNNTKAPVNNTKAPVLERNKSIIINVVGQGVAPMNTASPAQAYALAKRAAIADSYRLIAEKVKGVYVEGQDLIKNMMVKRSNVRTSVNAMVRNANLVETSFKEGLCEVEMEISIAHAQFTH